MLMPGLDIYFLKVRAHALLKVATKGSFRGKKSENLAFLGYFSEEKSEECSLKDWSVCNIFGIITSSSATYFLEVGARVSLKVATEVFLEIKKLLKFRFLDYFSKAKTEECDQEDLSVSDTFGIVTPCSATYHLDVRTPVSLKLATKASFGGKRTLKI